LYIGEYAKADSQFPPESRMFATGVAQSMMINNVETRLITPKTRLRWFSK
jgi:hypothetical protein